MGEETRKFAREGLSREFKKRDAKGIWYYLSWYVAENPFVINSVGMLIGLSAGVVIAHGLGVMS